MRPFLPQPAVGEFAEATTAPCSALEAAESCVPDSSDRAFAGAVAAVGVASFVPSADALAAVTFLGVEGRELKTPVSRELLLLLLLPASSAAVAVVAVAVVAVAVVAVAVVAEGSCGGPGALAARHWASSAAVTGAVKEVVAVAVAVEVSEVEVSDLPGEAPPYTTRRL